MEKDKKINDQDDNKVILSYYDCLIRQSDKNLLSGPHWLNDVIIGFYMEYLGNNLANKNKNKKIIFASPELTQLLKMMEPTDYPAIIDTFIEKNHVDFIFFPLNNSENRMEIGGSHWSLLIYSNIENSCFHYDSCLGANESIANKFSHKILKYFSQTGSGNFINVNCPQQSNAYDCGIFVLSYSEFICQQLIAGEFNEIKNCHVNGVIEYVTSGRKKIKQLIDKLKEDN